MTRCLQILTAALAMAFSLSAIAQDTLSYQGSIFNAARQPVTASYPIVFSLYAQREGGGAIWTENYNSVDIVDGTFHVELGSLTPFPADIGQNDALYLGVAVNQAPEMTPRVKVSSALRARFAAHAKDVRGEDIHPNRVSINDTEVINSEGQWVGDPSGLRGPQGEQGPQGEPGAGLDVNADLDLDGFPDWLEVMVGTDPTDETSLPASAEGSLVPEALRGPQGELGPRGPAGNVGAPGADGQDGAPGANGQPGLDGQDGANGVSVVDASIDAEGNLIFGLSSGASINAGNALANYVKTDELTNYVRAVDYNEALTNLQNQIDELRGRMNTTETTLAEVEVISASQRGYILGQSADLYSGGRSVNGLIGLQAMDQLCRQRFVNEPTAHTCHEFEIQRAIASGGIGDGLVQEREAWLTFSDMSNGDPRIEQTRTDFNTCALMTVAAHPWVRGTSVTIHLNSAFDRFSAAGDYYNINAGRACNANLPVMCCR